MTKRVLVTGGAGFIGSHMADRLLADGHEVVVIDNESSSSGRDVPAGATYIKGDVRNLDELEQAFVGGLDAVFHIAGQASTVLAFDDPHDDLNTNVGGTINVIQLCVKHGVSRLLFASSMTAYGHPETIPVPESEPCVPISYYGVTKYAAERYALSSGTRNDLTQPLNVTAFRMFNVYGSRQRLDNPYQGVMGIFVGRILREETIPIFGDGEQSRDFVYIDDVVDAWVTAWQDERAHGEVFNLGCGQKISMNALVNEISGAVGFESGVYPVNYGPERPGDQRHMAADMSHLMKTLGWKPAVSLAAGIRQTIEWAREEVVSE